MMPPTAPSVAEAPPVRVLIIDDDAVDRMAVRRALASAGVTADVVEVDSGEAALAALAELPPQRRFDVIMMDNLLPDYDGLQMLAHFHGAGVTTPVIMMTGQGSEQLAVDLMKAGAADYLSKVSVSTEHLSRSIRNAIRIDRAEQATRAAETELREQTRIAQALNRLGERLVAERDLQRLLQLVIDEATTLVGANWGAFLYNVLDDRGESYLLCALAGVSREGFEKSCSSLNVCMPASTFSGSAVVRLDDATADPRFGTNPPLNGILKGQPIVRSYLAMPVIGRTGVAAGGLFFGHDKSGVFSAEDERLIVNLANQTAVAIDNVRLYDALRRGEEQYRFLAEAIPQIVWTARPDGGLDYFNGAWTRYSGQTLETGGGGGWLEAVHPDDRQTVIDRWQHSLLSGEPYETEFRLRRLRDGADRWHLVRATPMRDASGVIVKWFGTCTDVHDWRHAQESLRIQRERLELVVDASELGLWYCDLPFDKLDWNVKCKQHFHLPPDAEVDIDLFWSRIHPDDRPRTRQAIDEAIGSGVPYDIDFRTVSPEGKISWIRAIGRCFFNATQQPARFDGITVDVTPQKESEQALRQAKESAEAANNAKDRFLAVLSHELRTPLMPVLTEVQSLEMEPALQADVRESLGVIRRNVELEARLIDDLLDLTRISKGKLQLNFDAVDLHAAIRSAMDICSADVVARRLSTSVDLSATRHHVRGDPARLQQVFWNLIKNAIKFTPSGGHITIHTYDDPGGATRVTVTDTGIGIEPDALARIFDAFEQVDKSVTRQFGGLGLGLAISRALIDLHGGKLRAASAGVGKGATFTVELRPCRAPSEAPPEQAPTHGARIASAINILLVDDHHDTNRAMARLLERMGYKVRTADSIRSALDAAADSHFDLLISDIGLPDGSGLELMRQLLARHESIKGIALSGFGMEEDVKKSKEAGFYEHLIKPINFSRLETAIRDLTARSS